MEHSKTVKEIMVDVFEFPHIPYWFSIKQAIGIAQKSLLSDGRGLDPLIILVFDEKYNLVGTLTLKDILKGLEPRFLRPPSGAQVPVEDERGLSLIWDSLFDREARDIAEHPVSEIMAPAMNFVSPGDPITKAAYLMIHNNMIMLPVLDEQKKFTGVVRLLEIFNELTDAILR